MAGEPMTSTGTGRTRIGAGELIEIGDALGRVLSIERNDAGDGLTVLVQVGDGELRRMKWADLVLRLLDRAPAPASEDPDGLRSRLLEELPPEDRKRVVRIYRELLQVETGSTRGNPEGDREAGVLDPAFDPLTTSRRERALALVERRKAQGESAASKSSVYRQLNEVRQRGIDALIHGNRKLHRDLLAEHDPEVIDRIREFLTLHKKEAQVATSRLVARIGADLEARGLGSGLTQYQLKLLVGEISRGMGLDRTASSRRTHAKKPSRVHGRHDVSAPGEMVQIDGTATTIHIWDDKLHWVPATVLSAIDCFTREMLALRVCAKSSTARDVAMLLGDIGRPTVSRAGWPYDLDHWHGVPRLACVIDQHQAAEDSLGWSIGEKAAVQPSTIVLDNGADMSADQLMAAAERMGITVVFCPPGTPHAKGMIEGLQNVMREIQSLLPGFKGENPVNHPSGIESGALLTAQDLHDALWEYVLTVYRWRPHKGLTESLDSPVPLSPGQAFINHITQHGGFVDVPKDPYRAILAMKSVECRLQDYGIRVDRRVYDSPELRDVASYYLDGLGARRRKITVYYDRYVTSHVFVRHPLTREWLRVPRKGHSRSAGRPWGELLTRHLVQQATDGTSQTLTDPQLFEAEKQFALRWRKGIFENRREQRIAAIEESRARQVAHDYGDLPEELVRLAFSDSAEPEPEVYPDGAKTSEDHEDDILDYTEIEAGDLAL